MSNWFNNRSRSRSARLNPRSTPVPFENLESRRLLSASPEALMNAGFEKIQWQGQETFARPGQWIAQVNNAKGAPQQQVANVNAQLARVRNDARATRHLGGDGLVLIETPKNVTHGELKASLARLGNVQHVEPDFAIWTDAVTTPNDTHFGSMWGLNNTGQFSGLIDADIDGPEAWAVQTGGSGIVVGVIDSGIDYNHPDLAPNVWINPGEKAGDGIDNDGNGYVDDVRGWDFFNNDNNPIDDQGHGTHVAGTIAAAGNNGAGVTGVSWSSKVMALKFLGADGTGSTSGAIGAINYATRMKTTGAADVRLTNNSWSGGGYSSSLYDAIRKHGEAGLLFIAAAGNGGSDQVGDDNDSLASYPSNYNLPNVIAVAATDNHDRLAGFSNFGATTVDLAAPGVSILSTTRGGNYGYSSGTSMAAPHVAGVAALAFSANPSATYTTVRDAMFRGVDAKASLAGKTATGGRLNAYNTLQQMPKPVVAPVAPSGLGAVAASSSQIDLAWTDNSGNEDGFRVFRSTDGTNFALIATVGANATRFASTGLAAGTTYHYRVRAYNSAGESAASNTAAATTVANTLSVPAAPSGLGATAISRSQIRLNWTDASSNENGFKIERSTDGRRWSQIATTGMNVVSFTDSGLRKKTTYYYRVRAFNTAGHSAYSNTATTKTTSTNVSSVKGSTAFSTTLISGEEDAVNPLLV